MSSHGFLCCIGFMESSRYRRVCLGCVPWNLTVTHWINIVDFMEPRAIKNLDSTHRPLGDGFTQKVDGLLLLYTSFNC